MLAEILNPWNFSLLAFLGTVVLAVLTWAFSELVDREKIILNRSGRKVRAAENMMKIMKIRADMEEQRARILATERLQGRLRFEDDLDTEELNKILNPKKVPF